MVQQCGKEGAQKRLPRACCSHYSYQSPALFLVCCVFWGEKGADEIPNFYIPCCTTLSLF